jgi:hypothetical protein
VTRAPQRQRAADLLAVAELWCRLQLEGVLYACTKHQEVMHNGSRAGFFIGDGAGVGKGRQICGIIIDNLARGRKKHVWQVPPLPRSLFPSHAHGVPGFTAPRRRARQSEMREMAAVCVDRGSTG